MKKLYVSILVIILGFVFTPSIYPENVSIDETVTFTVNHTTSSFAGYSILTDHNMDYRAFFSDNHLSQSTNLGKRLQSVEKPRLSSGQMIGCFLAGVAGHYAGAYTGVLFAGGRDPDLGDLLGMIAGYFTGSMFGSAVGVYLAGNSRNVRGSFGRTLGGSVLGLSLSIGIAVITDGGSLFYISSGILSSACALWLFKNSLRYKSQPEYGNALLNLHEGRLRVGVPAVSVQPLFDIKKTGKKSFRVNVNVFSLKL